MGRPIKKKFFGNLNQGSALTITDDGIGGEGITSTITVTSTGSNYSQGSMAVFSGPQVVGGVAATGSLTVSAPGAGGVTAVSLVDSGSGYTSTSTITITTATGVTKVSTGTNGATTITVANTSGIYIGMTVTGDAGLGNGNAPKVVSIGTGQVTVSAAHDNTFTGATLSFTDIGTGFLALTTLTASQDNALSISAYIPGGSSGVAGDIVKQEASLRYLVTTAQGTGQCKLTAVATGSLVEGEMNLIARDVNNSTYFVTKLTARRANLTQYQDVGGFEYASGTVAGWTIDVASAGVVSIATV